MKHSEHKKFSVEYNTILPGFIKGSTHYVASLDGKIKTISVACPKCKQATYVDNGFHQVEDRLIRTLGLNIKIAQFHCKRCSIYWSTERELVDNVIQKHKDFVKSLLLGAARQGLSLENATELVKDTVGTSYSPQYLYELYVKALDQVKQEKFSSASGVYYYDEQFLKENGQETCRLTVKDAVTEKVLLDRRAVNAQYGTIEQALRKALDGLPVEAFIVDMNQQYPGIILKLYPKAKIQWCIFHLDKLIWKELRDEFGKTISLVQLYNTYTLFNIFFDHSAELRKLEELLKKFDKYKGKDPQENKKIEHCLRQEFGKFVKALKKERRRNHELVPRRTLKQSERKFAHIKEQILLYPEKLQQRIRKIEENWEKFTLFQHDSRVQPTTNGIEHYFAATLAKTDKKDFRSKSAVARELAACQAEWNGKKLFPTTKLVEVLSLVGMLFLAFPP